MLHLCREIDHRPPGGRMASTRPLARRRFGGAAGLSTLRPVLTPCEDVMHRGHHAAWEELPADTPMEKLVRQRHVGERFMIARVTLETGCDVPLHDHENEQMVVVLEGHLEMRIGEEEAAEVIHARAGEIVHLPPGVPHRTIARERTVVVDIFSPVSETTGIDAGK